MKGFTPGRAAALALAALFVTPMHAWAFAQVPDDTVIEGGYDAFTDCEQAGTCTPPAPPPIPPGVIASNESFFEGNCTDCTGIGTAILILQNYTLGNQLTNSNFVSFAYSSNLTSYTITSSYILSGSLGNGVGDYNLDLEGSGSSPYGPVTYFFDATTANGGIQSWATGTTEPPSTLAVSATKTNFDVGSSYAFLTISSAPEPSTWALMVAGVGAIGAALRRRPRAGRVLAI